MRRCMRRGAARILLAVACACAALLRAHGVDLARAALPNGSFREGSVRAQRRRRGGDEDSLGTVRDDAAPVPSVHGMYSRPKLQRRVRQVLTWTTCGGSQTSPGKPRDPCTETARFLPPRPWVAARTGVKSVGTDPVLVIHGPSSKSNRQFWGFYIRDGKTSMVNN